MNITTATIIRIELSSDRLFIIANGVQRQLLGSERAAAVATLANVSAMVTVGNWTTFAVSAVQA